MSDTDKPDEPDATAAASPSGSKRLFWITFRISVEGGVVEGDLVADSERLDAAFLKGIKKDIALGLVRRNGGVIPPGMMEPILLACIELER